MIDAERRRYIRNLVAKLLLSQENLTSVIDVRDMKLPKNIYITTFYDYSDITGIPVKELSCDGFYTDGYTVKSDKANIILYDNKYDILCPQRLRFSLAHEIGHIFLRHTVDDEYSESEANYFASQVVAHDAIVLPMLSGNWDSDVYTIRLRLGVSWETAEIKLKYINRNKRAYSKTECELYLKYKNVFYKKQYSRHQFQIASSAVYVEYDEAYA